MLIITILGSGGKKKPGNPKRMNLVKILMSLSVEINKVLGIFTELSGSWLFWMMKFCCIIQPWYFLEKQGEFPTGFGFNPKDCVTNSPTNCLFSYACTCNQLFFYCIAVGRWQSGVVIPFSNSNFNKIYVLHKILYFQSL